MISITIINDITIVCDYDNNCSNNIDKVLHIINFRRTREDI